MYVLYVCRYKKSISTIYVVSRMDIYNIFMYICMYECMYVRHSQNLVVST